MELSNFQTAFQNKIIQSAVSPDTALEELIENSQRLNAYQDGYFLRVCESLAHGFPKVATVLGAPAFADLCRKYLTQHPSTSYDLYHLHFAFPDFLKNSANDFGSWIPQLAHFELLLAKAFHAFAQPELAAEDFRACLAQAPHEIKLSFQSHVFLLGFERNLYSLWTQINETQNWNGNAPQERAPEYLMIYRFEQEVMTMPLTRVQFDFYQGLMQGKNLELLCCEIESALPKDCDFPPLHEWMALGFNLGLFTQGT